MHWYGGSIAEAVTLCKQKNAVFVVFVEGDNDLSAEMSTVLDDMNILKRLSDQNNFLAVKLKSGSTNYTHFAQIYQFVPVPSLFFIGRNGTPLEVVCAGVQPDNLAMRIDRILEEHYKDMPPLQPSTSAQNIKEQTNSMLQSEAAPVSAPAPAAMQPSTSGQSLKQQTTELMHSEASPAPAAPAPVAAPATQAQPETSGPAAKVPKLEEYETVCDGDVCIRRPRGPPGAGSSKSSQPMETDNKELEKTESTLSAEEKMARAKELIEAKRREKAEKEKQLEREKEKERRNVGQGVAELKRWQADQELKQLQEERKRAKLENSLARQRILEQIAQDRAERRARDAAPAPATNTPAPAAVGDLGAKARIQFKLPDGESHTAHFDADGDLATVQRYVADNLQLSASQFSLWTAFPRRELTDPAATLRNLSLAPSAALLVLPRQQAVASPTGFSNIIAFLSQLFTSMILQPSQQLYEWLRARFGPAPRASSPPATGPRGPLETGAASSVGPRRRGNVHRLTGDVPPDDDNNTWNGNSTQQM